MVRSAVEQVDEALVLQCALLVVALRLLLQCVLLLPPRVPHELRVRLPPLLLRRLLPIAAPHHQQELLMELLYLKNPPARMPQQHLYADGLGRV